MFLFKVKIWKVFCVLFRMILFFLGLSWVLDDENVNIWIFVYWLYVEENMGGLLWKGYFYDKIL